MIGDKLQKHIKSYMKDNLRYDGRKLTDYRKIEIEYDVSNSAEGSARVKVGNTEVIAGVKMAVEKPYPDTPKNGNLMVNAELMPLSSPEFESGPPDIRSIELARVIDRGIRESGAIDTKKLCITPGEEVWSVMVDICTLNDDGNLLDCAGIAAMAAIKNAKFPKYENKVIDYKTRTDVGLPILKYPIPVTVYKLGDYIFVDPGQDEEKAYEGRLTVTSIGDGTICALQKGGYLPLTIENIKAMTDLGLKVAGEIRKNFKE